MMTGLFFFYILFISTVVLSSLNYVAKKTLHYETSFNNKTIPIGSGLLIPISLLTFYPFVGEVIVHEKWMMYSMFTLSLGTIGFIDDRYGTKKIKGIKGHLLHLVKNKKITSGFIKMFGIIFTGLFVSLHLYQAISHILLSTLTFAAWTNIFNFLDVRPARALKSFWIVFFIILIVHHEYVQLIEWSILLLTLPLFLIDILQKGMLGDAGSNVLGGIVGYWIIYFSSILELFLWLILGLMFTYYAEKKSFSTWIEKHPLIRKIDRWGLKASD